MRQGPERCFIVCHECILSNNKTPDSKFINPAIDQTYPNKSIYDKGHYSCPTCSHPLCGKCELWIEDKDARDNVKVCLLEDDEAYDIIHGHQNRHPHTLYSYFLRVANASEDQRQLLIEANRDPADQAAGNRVGAGTGSYNWRLLDPQQQLAAAMDDLGPRPGVE